MLHLFPIIAPSLFLPLVVTGLIAGVLPALGHQSRPGSNSTYRVRIDHFDTPLGSASDPTKQQSYDENWNPCGIPCWAG
jgi:hypothetical protein